MTESAGGSDRLEFRILGPLEVLRGGVLLRLGGRQQRAVLALLVAHPGSVVSTARLAEALWGEHPPAGYVTSLQTYVFHLRELLEPGRARGTAARILATEPGGGYRLLVDAVVVDTTQFASLAAQGAAALEAGQPGVASHLLDRALAFWRGDVLADLGQYVFVTAVAAPWQELRLATLEARLEADLQLGRHDAALPELDRLIAEHPLRERLQAKRMLALYRSGRQSDALSAYRNLRVVLRDELGIEPSPPVQELHGAILGHDVALDWQPPARAARPDAEVATAQPNPIRRPRSRRVQRRPLVASTVAAALLVGGASTAFVAFDRSPAVRTLAANSVGQISADGSISAVVAVGTNPAALAYGGAALWVANRSDNTVWQVDPSDGAVLARVRVGLTPTALAVDDRDLWVANFGDGTVSRVNLRTAEVTQPIDVGIQPAAIAAGPHGVWVALSGANSIRRIDQDTGVADAPIEVGDGPDGIAVDGDSVWVANGRDGHVMQIDAASGEAMFSPIRVGSGPRGIAISGDDVWVANELSQSVSRISRRTKKIHSIAVGDGPGSVAVGADAVWVSAQYDGVVSRIDPDTEKVREFPVGSSPRGLTSGGSRIWVASAPLNSAAHRGGTLTIAAERAPARSGGIDPAEVYDLPISNPEHAVYDGLVTTRAGSSDSQVLVPDLATEVPEPGNGGLTYTFLLRPGIRYSTGALVRASDFALGVRRALTLTRGNPGFYARIIGGQACIDDHDACDLSQGVVTDDVARRVTFHLTQPDPDFLYKLCFFVYPTPPGTSLGRLTTPMPGTGPYMMTDYGADQQFTLRRNRYFVRWSQAAQPDAYPDVIRWLPVANTNAAAAAVERGEADLAWLTPLGDHGQTEALVNRLNISNPGQLHADLLAGASYELLNTAVPPFDHLEARQALNYAVDRRELVRLNGGIAVAEPTCQILPREFPGHEWYCPYTTGPADGRYYGPDLTKARVLVRSSGTLGQHVNIYGIRNGLGPPFDDYIAQVLRGLGYRVSVHELANNAANGEFLYSGDARIQLWSSGWIADYPRPSNFYYAVSGCHQHNANHYCNPALDARAAQAEQSSDPGAALKSWTAIDHDLVDQAVIVPATNSVDRWFVAERVGNYQSSQNYGPTLSQMWVK